MKPGELRAIYEDPLTQTKKEGMATLILKLKDDLRSEYWEVQFDGEARTYFRWIAKEDEDDT